MAKMIGTSLEEPAAPRGWARAGAAALVCGLTALACAGKSAAPQEEAAAAGSEVASGVNATVIVSKCPDAPHMNVRTAQDTIQKLVGRCAKVPGGSAHFRATLQPGGRIELASPEGDP